MIDRLEYLWIRLLECLAESLQAITKLKGEVELVAPNSLPNDGRVIADERSYT